MRRPLALVMSVLALACWPPAAAAVDPAPPTRSPLALYGLSGRETYLARLDPLTLAPRDPVTVVPEWHGGVSFSPDGRQAAFTVSTNGLPSTIGRGRVGMRTIDLATLETVRDFRLGIAASAVGWLTPRRIVAHKQGGEVVLADPVTGEFTRTGRSTGECIDPPGKGTTARALVMLLGRHLHAVDKHGRVRHVSLRGMTGACGRLGFALDAERERAFVVGIGRYVAEVNLRGMRVTYRAVGAARAERVDSTRAQLFGDRLLVASHVNRRGMPKGVELIDTRAGTRRMIDPRAGRVAVVGGLALAYDGRYPVSPGGSTGLRAFDRDGDLRFRVLTGEVVHRLQVLGRHAYAQTRGGLRVIDLRARRVVARSELDPNVEIDFLQAVE